MDGPKSAILAISQKSANWLDWLDWPCPVSAALQNRPQDFVFSFIFQFSFIFFKYETIVRSSAWYFCHSDPDPSSVNDEFVPNLTNELTGIFLGAWSETIQNLQTAKLCPT